MTNNRKPGYLGEINIAIPLTIGAITFILSVVAICIFIFQIVDREVIKFIVSTLGVVAGVTSAFYVGESIRQNLSSREEERRNRELELAEERRNRELELAEERRNRKAERAMRYISIWTNPQFAEVRKSARTIRDLIKDKPKNIHSRIIKDSLDQNNDLAENIVTILNFLEEVALAVDMDLVDEDVIFDYFKVIVKRYCHVFELWIAEERRERGNELYRALTSLHEKWSVKRSGYSS